MNTNKEKNRYYVSVFNNELQNDLLSDSFSSSQLLGKLKGEPALEALGVTSYGGILFQDHVGGSLDSENN